MTEYEFVGGMRGKPVDVINGPVTGLPIPADAEIVLEGFVDPATSARRSVRRVDRLLRQRPRPEPVLHVKAIYHRNDPIMLGCAPQRPPDEICRYRAFMRSALLRERSRRRACPASRGVWCTRSAARGCCSRSPSTSATPATPAGRPHRRHVPRRRLPRALRDRRRRRHRRDESRGGPLGDVTRSDPATSIDIIRSAWHAARPAHPARAQGARRPHQQAGGHRRLPALALARPVPEVNVPTPEERRIAQERFGHLFKN